MRPLSWMEATTLREKDGTQRKIPTYPQHLLCDEKGDYPAMLNDREQAVLKQEMQCEGFRFWYRNPNRSSQDSLGIAYREGEDINIMHPDFLSFAESPDGSIAVDIIDPHGHHLADALPKLQGLACYAQTHGQHYRRIEAIAEVRGKLRVLDMTRSAVRQAVMEAASAKKKSICRRDGGGLWLNLSGRSTAFVTGRVKGSPSPLKWPAGSWR